MNYIKHQITENTCEYVAFELVGAVSCTALIVDISNYGNHEIRLGVYFGQYNDQVEIEKAEFLCAFEEAESSFRKFSPIQIFPL